MSTAPPPLPAPRYQPPAPSGRNPWPWIIGTGCGCLGLAGVAIVIGMVWLGGLGVDALENQIVADLADNPDLERELGEIEEAELDWRATMTATEKDIVVLKVRGTKSSGVLMVESVTLDDDTEHVVSGTLEVGGETHDLFPEDAGPSTPAEE